MGNGRRRSDRQTRVLIKKHRATAYRQIPDRGTVHPLTGETVTGLEPTVLKHRGLTAEEQADNSTTHRVLAPDAVRNVNIAETIAAGKLPTLGGMQGDLPESKLPNIGKNKLPNDIQYGRPKASELDYGAGRPIPAGKVGEGYAYRDLKDPPKLGKFVTKSELQNELKKYQKK